MTGSGRQGEEAKAPLSFKLMVAMTALYLGWRLVQGIIWLIGRFA